MRLLLAEDERRAGEYLVKGLGESGFVVDWVRNGVDALHRARSEIYDLIVLDIGLPQLDGWAVLEHIRQATRHMGALIDDLLSYSRLERREQLLANQPLAAARAYAEGSLELLRNGEAASDRIGPALQGIVAEMAVRQDPPGGDLASRPAGHLSGSNLTRVALKRGSLVVNSSQGGGSKDTWVLAE